MISRLPRRALRAGLISAVVASSTLVASPAFAKRDDGDDPGESISTLKAVLIFGGAPLGAFLLIALLVSLPSIVKGPRYRPGKGWQGTPEWYGAPGAEQPEVGGGSDSAPALTGTIVDAPEGAASAEGGGASARW